MIRFCLHCNTHHQGRCPNAERRRGTPTQRGYTSRWAALSKRLIARSPRCAHCGSTNDLTTDHIIPKSQGGTDAPHNLHVLCRPCNSSKRDNTNRGGVDKHRNAAAEIPIASHSGETPREVWIG